MNNFQTPLIVCDYMTSLLPKSPINKVLEPTPGEGNLVKSLNQLNINQIIAPDNFFDINDIFDYIVMNPPFTPMDLGYSILYRCMEMSDNIIALMPWLTMINSQKRTKHIMDFGLKSITNLPRKTFKGSRVQCCILEMEKGWNSTTLFKNFDF